jgi:hypothetical protein
VHSLSDFNLQIPANAALFFLLAAIAGNAVGDAGAPKVRQPSQRDGN